MCLGESRQLGVNKNYIPLHHGVWISRGVPGTRTGGLCEDRCVRAVMMMVIWMLMIITIVTYVQHILVLA